MQDKLSAPQCTFSNISQNQRMFFLSFPFGIITFEPSPYTPQRNSGQTQEEAFYPGYGSYLEMEGEDGLCVQEALALAPAVILFYPRVCDMIFHSFNIY